MVCLPISSADALFAGAWIEIEAFRSLHKDRIDALFAGAWIEIRDKLTYKLQSKVTLPSWERGLKL